MRRKLKPREWAARLVTGEVTIEQVPEAIRGWCIWHIQAVARQLRDTPAHDSKLKFGGTD